MNTTHRTLSMTAIGALVATLALTGCDKADRTDAKATADRSMASTEQKAREVGADAKAGMEKAKDATTAAAVKVGDKVDDALITTSVKTELAKDASLSALKINVDTEQGRVALKSTAPSTAAREHATVLAQNVKGVVSVDNQLKVDGS
ncbi:MAG: BON domain-containing protein [Caldimonas sp.]